MPAAMDKIPVAITAANTSGEGSISASRILTSQQFDDQVPNAGMPVAASPFDGLHNPHAAEARQHFLVQHSQFQAGQIGAQAVMHALTEAQVRIGFSGDVELVGAVEHAGIAVGRALPDLHLLSRPRWTVRQA